jgi:type II secretion system protein D
MKRAFILSFVVLGATLQARAQAAPTNAPPPKSTTAKARPVAERDIRFQFDGIPYADVLERFAQMAKKPLVADTKPEGALTFHDPMPYTFGEAVDTLNVILAMKGFALTEDDHYLRLIPLAELSREPLKILQGAQTAEGVRPEELVTVVLALKNLEAQELAISITNLLTKAGSVAPLSRGRGLIITDRLANIKRIESLISVVDTEAILERQMKSYTLLHASGALLQDLVNRTFGKDTAAKRIHYNPATKRTDLLDPDPAEYITAVYDDASRTMILFGPGERLQMAEELINKFEDNDAGGGEVRIYRPELKTAEELSEMIRQAVPGIAAPGEAASSAATKARLIVDSSDNRLIVATPLAGMADEIENVINRLDLPVHGKEGEKSRGVKREVVQLTQVFEIQSIEISMVGDLLKQVLTRKLQHGSWGVAAKITVEPNSKTVVVTGSPADVRQAADIITQLEGGTPVPVALETRFIDLGDTAEAARLTPVIEEIYQSQIAGRNQAQSPPAKIIGEPDSGRLIVTATAEDLTRIESIVSQIQVERPKQSPRKLKIFALRSVRLETSFPNISELINERMAEKRFAGLPTPLVIADNPNNRLLVTASDEQMSAVEQVISVMDVAASKPSRTMTTLAVRSKSPEEMIALVTELTAQLGAEQGDAGLAPKLFPDPASKQIIVLATGDDAEQIGQLVKQLDSATVVKVKKAVRAIELFGRKADDLVTLVQQLYQEQVSGAAAPEGGAATLLAETRDNRILVSGTEAEITRVEAIVRQLDPEGSRPSSEETRVFTLQAALASDLSSIVEQAVAAESPNAKILTDPRSNSLVITGHSEALETAAKLIEQLDKRPRIEPREMRVIDLNQADAASLAEMVTALASEMMRDQRGPDYTPQTRVVPDTVGGRLVISGPRDELVIYASVVEQLDKAGDSQGGARVFPLKNADAEQVAEILTKTMVTFDSRNQPIQRVSVSADRNSNSVVVSGAREDLKDAENIIMRLDGGDGTGVVPAGGLLNSRDRELRVFTVADGSAANLAPLAQSVFSAQNNGRPGTELVSFTASPDGRQLIVMAPASLARQVETVVTLLNSKPAADPRELQRVDIKGRRASDVVATVQQIYSEQAQGQSGQPATIYTDPAGTGLMVYGSLKQGAQVRQIVDTLSTVKAPARKTQIFDVGSAAEAERLMPLVQQIYQNDWEGGADDPADARIITDGRTGRLIVSGPESHLSGIEKIVKSLTSTLVANPLRETRAFEFGGSAEAERLLPIVQQLYTDRWKGREDDDPADAQLVTDGVTGRLIVSARAEHLAVIEEIIKSVKPDMAPKPARETKVIDVGNAAEVQRLQTLVQQLYTDQWKDKAENDPADAQILPDPRTGRLIVTGKPEHVREIEAIIEQFNIGRSSSQSGQRETKVLDLKGAKAAELAETVQTLYQEQSKDRFGDQTPDTLILADASANRLIVSGDSTEVLVVEEIVSKLDIDAAQGGPARLFVLQHADPKTVARILTQAITGQDPNAPSSRISFRFNRYSPSSQKPFNASADVASRTVIVSGEPKDLLAATAIIEQLDQPTDVAPRNMKVVRVNPGAASQLVTQARSLFEDQAKSRPSLRGDDILIMEGADGNQLIIAGTDEQLEVIDGILTQLKAQTTDSSERERKVLELSEGESVDKLLPLVQQLYEDRWKDRGSADTPDAQLLADPENRRLIVSGRADHIKEIEAILETVRGTERAMIPRETRVYDITASDADELADTVRTLYDKQLKSRGTRPDSEAMILEDRATNRIVVSAIPEELKAIDEIILQLDKASLRDDSVRFFTLKTADPVDLASILSSVVVQYSSRGVAIPKVTVSADPIAGTLVVTGSPDDLELAAKIIEEYEANAIPREERIMRFVKVQDADPDEVAKQLEKLYGAQMKASGKKGGGDAIIMGDDAGNRVILTARKSEIALLDEILTQLREGWDSAGKSVQLFTLKHVPASPVADMIDQLFDRRPNRKKGEPPIGVTASPDDRSVLVDADSATLERITELIATLDQPRGDGSAVIQTIHLAKAEAEAVAEAINESIQADGANPKLKDVSVTPVQGTKALLLNGPAESVQEVMKIVKELDEESAGGEVEVRIFQLKSASARDIEPVLGQLLRSVTTSGSSGRSSSSSRRSRSSSRYYGGDSSEPTITIHETSNRLLITAKPDQFKLVEQLISELDKAPEQSNRDVQFVWLKTADAFDVVDKIDAFYDERSRREKPFLEADYFGNQITIIAKRSDMPQIKDLIEQFDQGIVESDLQVRMVSLARIPVEEMARMLTNIYPQMHSGRLRIVDRLTEGVAPRESKPAPDAEVKPAPKTEEKKNEAEETADNASASEIPEVVISVDKNANMLILSGPATELDNIDSIITELEWFAIPGDSDMHVYSLKMADPATVAKTLNDLFKYEAQALAAQQQAKPKSGSSQQSQSRSVRPPKMIVVPEPRTRSIIVRASPTDYLMVESLIEQLDQAGEQSKIVYRLIPLKNAPAAKLEPMLKLMAQQLKAAQPGDATEIQAYDRNRSMLLIGRDPVIDELEEMIRDLDIPATDEEIDVLQIKLKFADAKSVEQTLNTIFSRGSQLAPGAKGEPELGSGKALAKPLNVAADARLNTVFLSGPAQAVELAESIVGDMDQELEGFLTEVKLIQLRYASSVKVLPLLQAVFAEGPATPESEGVSTFVTRLKMETDKGGEVTSDQPKSRVALVMQADESLNILIVAARSDALPLIEAVIKQLDIPKASGLATVRIYPLEHADASALQSIISEIYTGPRAAPVRATDRPSITVDQRSNSLVVSGTENSFAMLDSLLSMLDTELPLELRDIHIVPLEHADANELAGTIQSLMDSRISRLSNKGRGQADSHRVLIVAEQRSNSLLVAGGKDSFELVKSLAERLDSTAPAVSGTIRLLPLDFADARTVASSLDSLFAARYASTRAADRQRNKPVIVADSRINALMISAAIDDNEIIDELLPKLDRKLDNPSLLLTVVPLKHNDAAQVSGMLENIFKARLRSRAVPGQAPSPSEEVEIEVDSLNNTLIVSSNKENLASIQDLLEQLDVQPMMADGVFETFVLEHVDAQRVATLIQSMIEQGLYRPGRPAGRSSQSRAAGEALAVAVDQRSNTLIVSASPENLGVVKEVIRKIDTEDFEGGGGMKFYRLENAQASDVATILNQFFDAKRAADSAAINASERGIPVSIIPDDRINTLLVTGSKEAFDTMDRILPDLDGEDQISQQNFKVFPLKYTTATALQDTLQKLFANRPTPIKGQSPDPITLVADAWVNVLIVGARVHDMTMVESMIEKLDSDQAELGVKVEVIPVLKADVQRIAETVQALYREGKTSSALPVFVNPDERMNALIVSGGETDLKRIKEVVRKLDTDQVSRVSEIRVIPLEYARADSLSTILNAALNSSPTPLANQGANGQAMLQFITASDDGEQFVTAALQEAVLITPDTRMNSLIVSGPVDYMGLLERIVHRLDDASPRQAQIKVFALKYTDARRVGQLLLGLFRMTPTGAPTATNDRSIEYTLYAPTAAGDQALASAVIGAEEQSALTISIDSRSNSVLVGGSEHYIGLVSEVIASLDKGEGVQRKSEVYRLKNAQAADIATAIRDFLDQDRQRITQVLGADAVSTAEALLEKEVSIVAEPVSNTLLLSAHSHYFDNLSAMIEELDRAQPQVLVRVLLAEITVDAMRDLGVEWNYTKNFDGGWNLGTGTDLGVPNELATLGGYSALVTGNNFNFLLRALESDGHLEVLSRPQILTADNQPASINIGQRIPLITGSQITPQGGVNNQFEYRDVGVNLSVTPRIVGDGFVQIDVQTTNSSLSSSTVPISATATVPIINERRASTMVSVQSGQTVIIGGLISASEDSRKRKMPLLGNIPVLGHLFRNSRNVSDRKELLILLTPQILTVQPTELWEEDILDYSNKEIDESSMKDVFKDDKAKRAMFNRVFPAEGEPEDANPENPKPLKKQARPKPE